MSKDQIVREDPPRVTWLAASFTLLALFALSALCGMVIMAALAVINIGGYCAEGGPYEIAQHCPSGSAVVLSAGLPLMFLVGFLYMLAKPRSWPSTIGWLWPILFVGMAIAFFIGASNAPGGVGWLGIAIGILMLAIGVGPLFMVLGRSSDSPGEPRVSKLSPPYLSQSVALVAGVCLGAWAWTLFS